MVAHFISRIDPEEMEQDGDDNGDDPNFGARMPTVFAILATTTNEGEIKKDANYLNFLRKEQDKDEEIHALKRYILHQEIPEQKELLLKALARVDNYIMIDSVVF